VIRTDVPSGAAGSLAPFAARRWSWIFGARADLAIALCWIPIFAYAHVLSVSGTNDLVLNRLFRGAFVLSLLHQPLTLALVYGDRDQFAMRKRLFTWSPPVAVALIATAVLLDLWIVVPIAAIWNTVHTLQQRYGLSRIYSRKSGYGSARLDRAVLYIGMAAALFVAGSSTKTLEALGRVMLDDRNASAITDLTSIRPYALWLVVPALAAFAVVLGMLIRQERAHLAEANPAKWLYVGSSLALIAAIAWDPLAGFVAYVAAHAIEYTIVVDKTVEKRYAASRPDMPLLGRLVRDRRARMASFAIFVAVILVFDARVRTAIPGHAYLIVVYSIGILHFWYDSFIWKLRRPSVAKDLGIPTPIAAPG
jgi:hypothetical protein